MKKRTLITIIAVLLALAIGAGIRGDARGARGGNR